MTAGKTIDRWVIPLIRTKPRWKHNPDHMSRWLKYSALQSQKDVSAYL